MSTVSGEKEAKQVTAETDLLMQEWQQAITGFKELKASTLEKVPELGPLFEQGVEKEKTGLAMEESGLMETEAVEKNRIGTSQ